MGERVVEILKANPDQSFFFAFGAGESQGEVLGLFFSFPFFFLGRKVMFWVMDYLYGHVHCVGTRRHL